MPLKRITSYLHAVDVLVIGLAILLSIVNLVFSSRIAEWRVLIVINLAAIATVILLAYLRHTLRWKFLSILHDWYVVGVVFLSFKELYFMVTPIHFGRDYDDLLIEVDRWLFGLDPTVWIGKFAHPWITEILQLAYTSFYFLFIVLGTELYRRHNPDLFHFFLFTCVYGFFLSFMGYFFLPAVGPRFILHDFSALDAELPGVLLTPYLRWFVNIGGSVPMGVPNDVALAGTQRDAFPSGHTMMTLVLMYLSARLNARCRTFLWVVGTLLIIATIYQRYHYVIDLVAGALFFALCVGTSPRLYNFTKTRLHTMESRFPAPASS